MRSADVSARRPALHLAALSLIAWYLMVPPTVPGTHEINQSAPLSQWTIRRSFPREAGCLSARDRVRQIGQNRMATETRGRSGAGHLRWCVDCHAECVATDDPRIKGK